MSEVWTVAEPVSKAFFRCGPKWLLLGGRAYGLSEPILIGSVQLSVPGKVDLRALDRGMAEFIEEPLPADLQAETVQRAIGARVIFWAGALQRQHQIPVFGKGQLIAEEPTEKPGVSFKVALPSFHQTAALAAFAWVGTSVDFFLQNGRMIDLGEANAKKFFDETRTAIDDARPGGINIYRFCEEAYGKHIPYKQIGGGVLCFGMGARNRWMQSTFTDRTSSIGARIANDKVAAAHVLRLIGLPAPEHSLVSSADGAVRTATKMGYPVVVKPADRHQGVGVAAGLTDEAAVRAAFEEACKHSKRVIVEKHFDGIDYRMIVLDGKLLRVRGRLPGGVIGDGVHTIAELVELRRQAPENIRRERERGGQLLMLDKEALELLAEHDLSADQIPAPRQYVRLRRRGNVSAGGTSYSVEAADVHPDNRRMAELAVAALRLDLGGLDVIMPDISRSWMETGAIICEVNAQPQASTGVLDILLGGDARIPFVLVIGEEDRIDWDGLENGLPANEGIALAGRNGLRLSGERITSTLPNGLIAGEAAFANIATKAAIVVMSPAEVRQMGVPSDRLDLVIFDRKDRWRDTDDQAVSEILDMVLPHARKVVAIESDTVRMKSQTADRMRKAGTWEVRSGSLQSACEEAVGFILPLMPRH